MPILFPLPEPKWIPRWWDFLKTRCTQRILIVTDWTQSFDPGSATGLTELIRVLEGVGEVPMAMPTTVTKVSTASVPAFSFTAANPAVTIANYDQVWLFGFNSGGAGLSVAARKVLTKFMEAGGGVFATGDHSSIGQPLCGGLPRVQKMREWSAVPMSGASRIDTVNHPGVDNIASNADQSDAFPQTMYPLLNGVGAGAAPHALLQSPHGAINVLPDHPHESECYAPRGTALDGNYSLPAESNDPALSVIEFPQVAGQRHGPELVAISMSASLNVDKGPVAPRCFGAISAYDGQVANKGRVVCDATWHHFVNMNLNGAGYGGTGLREGNPLAPNAAYLQVQRYFANIADWLTPKSRRWCSIFSTIALTVYAYPFMEEVTLHPQIPRPLPPEPPWPVLVQVGSVVQEDIRRRKGPGAFEALADDMVLALDISVEAAQPLFHGLRGLDAKATDKTKAAGLSEADSRELVLGLVGGVFLRASAKLPADPDQLAEQAEKLHKEGFAPYRAGYMQDLKTGIETLQKRHQLQTKALTGLAKAVS